MNKIVLDINNKKDIIEKIEDKYIYNSKVIEEDSALEFVSKLIRMCRSIEKRRKVKSNNKIEIYENTNVITLTGIDLQVIKYIDSFLK